MNTLTINSQFQHLIPQPSKEELTLLEQSLLEDGCRDSIIIWNNTIVDGHNRYSICKKHNLPFKTESKSFDSEEEAEIWIIKNQLSRRNLTDQQRTYFLGRLYGQHKKQHGGDRKASGQNEHLKTSDLLAEQHNVSASTVKRAGKYSTDVDNITDNVGDDFKSEILSGKLKA